MKHAVAALIGLCAIVYSIPILAEDTLSIPGAYMFGRDYIKLTDNEKAIYVMGMADGYSFGSWQHIGPPKEKRSQFQKYLRCAEPASSAFLKAALDDYLRLNPKAQALPMPFAFGGAVQATCNK